MKIENTYKSKIIEKKIDDEIYFASIHNTTEFTDTIQKEINKRFIQFYFCVSGNVTFHFSRDYSRILETENSYMIFNPSDNLPLSLNITNNTKLCILVVSSEKMKLLFTSNNLDVNLLMKSFEKKIYEENKISFHIKSILHQMESYNLKKEFERLYLSGKMYELLIHYFSEKEEEKNCPFILDEEIALKIKKAKDILVSDLQNGIKINELSQKIGLSEYKLQEGFKKIYNTTIYGYFLNFKLEYAKNKLFNSDVKIKEIASEIGYDNTSHFIEAFKKKYKSTPKQYLLKQM
ncbi:MAG: helix-turn-helix transcriptional regulator [Flavobacteriales bacterium]|nr:helix-turn-helix transcriptional regulator [Flavobacteriales bacterium]